MQRYFISKEELLSRKIRGSDCHHIGQVMRAKIGDKLEICADSKLYLIEIVSIDKDAISFNLINEIAKESNDNLKITLIQGLAKGDKNDEIIKHSTEIGVDNIVMVQMIRSIAKIEASKEKSHLERFNKIAKEASQQAHRYDIPDVSFKNNLKAIDHNSFDLKLLLDEEEAKKDNPFYLNGIDIKEKKSISFIVGPEGGIDPLERNYLLDLGYIPVALGKNILRTETASLAFLAMLAYKRMDD